MSEPTATSIMLTREKELAFPAVTICSLSLLNTTVLKSSRDTVITNLMKLFDDIQKHSNISQCKIHANQLATNIGKNVSWSWGELTDIARSDLQAMLED